MIKKVYLRSYGCQMNEYDSELVHSILEKDGYRFVESDDQADVILLNTCSVRESAVRKIYGAVREIRHRHKNKNLKIGILGCIPTHQKENLFNLKSFEIDFIAGPDSYKKLPQLIRECSMANVGNGLKPFPTQKPFDITLSEFETYEDIYPKRKDSVNAWIAIMRGCNNFCSFCVVPYARGRERSRNPEDILREVKRLTQEGFAQVTLIGQNVNSYKAKDCDFSDLLNQISKVSAIKRIRFVSPHPKDFPDKLIDTVANDKKVCPHIHLPLQSGNDRILKLMNRKYTKTKYLKLVDKIRKRCPNVALTTDIIVGFPSETEDEFNDTLDVIKKVQYDAAFIFKYSPRSGTQAAQKFEDDVTNPTKTKRIVKLNDLQKKISLKQNKRSIGQTEEILIERTATASKKGQIHGRTGTNKIVTIPSGPYRVGDFVNVSITSASPHVLRGKVISP